MTTDLEMRGLLWVRTESLAYEYLVLVCNIANQSDVSNLSLQCIPAQKMLHVAQYSD